MEYCFRNHRPGSGSDKPGRKRQFMWSSITVVYDIRIWSPYKVSVLLRTRSRRYKTIILDHVIRQNTIVCSPIGSVYGHLQAYTKFVIVDLSTYKSFHRVYKLVAIDQ